MNRQERRRLEQKGVGKSQVMNQYCNELYEKGYKAGRNETIDIVFYMTAYTIQYKLGFGRKRLPEIMRAIYNNVTSFGTGQLYRQDFTTIKNMIEDKYGVKISNERR